MIRVLSTKVASTTCCCLVDCTNSLRNLRQTSQPTRYYYRCYWCRLQCLWTNRLIGLNAS